MSLYAFPTQVADAVQQGILDLAFQGGVDSNLAFSAFTFRKKMDANLGNSKTFTQNSRLPVSTTPRSASDASTDLNNGMTATKAGIEQYTMVVDKYNGFDTVNLLQDKALIAPDLVRSADNLGDQAIRTKERLVRKAYMDSYIGGSTQVISGGTLSTVSCHVDDIRGFQNILDSTGKIVPVSGGATLSVQEITPAGTVVQTLTVTGATADGSNVCNAFTSDPTLGGISGQLTFSTASTPTVGNALLASQAPAVIRAGAKVHTGLINGGDIATIGLFDAGVTYLRNQAMKGIGGFIYALVSPTTMSHLRRDPTFQLSYQGRFEAPEIRLGKIVEYGGVRYVETNEIPVTTNANGTIVHRSLLIGHHEACMEADWQGFDEFLNEKNGNSLHYTKKIQSNLAMIIRAPIDAQGEIQPLSWMMITGFSCGSDQLANQSTIPTASNSMFKKALWLESAAA